MIHECIPCQCIISREYMLISYRYLSIGRFRLDRMSSFTCSRAPSPVVDEFLSSVYQGTPRNVFSVSITGGGSAVISDLFTVPGASNSLMNASIPYSHAALSKLLGGPDHPQACSKDTAILMARAVFKETISQLLHDNNNQFNILSEANVFGVAGTAALVSSRPKKGLHRCHVATFSNNNVIHTWDVFFRKGLRTRREEDYACSRVILDAIATSSNLPALSHEFLFPEAGGEVDEFNPDLEVETIAQDEISTVESVFDDLFTAQTGMLTFIRKPIATNSAVVESGVSIHDEFTVLEDMHIPTGALVYPGSYNPLHEGHIALAAAAMKLHVSPSDVPEAANPFVFEISALNADKPPLSKDEIIQRVRQFSRGSAMDTALQAAGITNIAVCVTSRPFFEGKAALFPGCRFVMGADTLTRLLLPKYYGNSMENMLASVSHITEGHGCSFIIGGRKDTAEESGFCDLDCVLSKVQLPDCIRANLTGLSDEQFRVDISSTEIRNRTKTEESMS